MGRLENRERVFGRDRTGTIVGVRDSGEELWRSGMLGAFDIDDGQALVAGGDVGVGSRDVYVSRVGYGHGGLCGSVGQVDDFEAFRIAGEEVAELDGGVARYL